VGARPSEPSIFKPDDPGSVHPLLGEDSAVIVRWWSENKAIGWHHPREAGNQTRRVASAEGEWAVSMLAVGVEMRIK